MRTRPAVGPLVAPRRPTEATPSRQATVGASAQAAPRPPAALDVFTAGRPVPPRLPAATAGAEVVVRAEPNAPIPDAGSLTSTLELPAGASVEQLALDLQIAHTWRGDLSVTLTSPSGKSAVVQDRQGGSADDLRGAFDVSEAFRGEPAAGTWTLTVTDAARRDTGTLEAWGLTLTPAQVEPTEPTEPKPPHPDADPLTHLYVLASDEMQGRDSASPGFDAASRYVADKLTAWGVAPGNAGNVDDPFYQPFEMRRLSGTTLHHEHDTPHSTRPEDFSREQFEDAFYLSPDMSSESLELVNERYFGASWEQGIRPRSGSGPRGQLTIDELRDVSEAAGTVQNVVGRIEGTGPNKDQAIVLMAHLDHVGVTRNGQVYNGADDNASGSSVLLSLLPKLQELQAQGKLDRSIVVVWTAAEEKGLVGASYFKDHPLPGMGLAEIDGVINMDMVGRWDDERLSILDSTKGKPNYWRGLLEEANARMDNPFDRLNRDINAFADRQDGAIFSRAGEDVLMLFEGLSKPTGGGDLIPEYHGVGDDIDLILRDNGGEKLRRVAELTGYLVELASNREA